ncbi:MAG: TRAP transporter substrate-binding protein [Planctomycetaceae bacterium]|nr:TRAP transporter substrate-binding protein [Planctomycetaceae bacterium]
MRKVAFLALLALTVLIIPGITETCAAGTVYGTESIDTTTIAGEKTWTNDKGLTLESGPDVTLTFGALYARGSIPDFTNRIMVDTINAWSNGKIKISYVGAGELGSNADIVEAVQMGNIAMSMVNVSNYANFVPEFGAFDMGCIIAPFDKFTAALKNEKLLNIINTSAADADMRLLGMCSEGFRVLLSCRRPIHTFEDLKGLKIRTQPAANLITMWQNLTTNPTPLPTGEVYISMQQGLIDAIENNPTTFIAEKTFEQGKFITLTNHIPSIHGIMFNVNIWNGLSASYKAMLEEVFEVFANDMHRRAKEDNAKALDFMKSKGIEVVDMSMDDLLKMEKACDPQHKMIEEAVGSEICKAWLDAVKN